MGTSLGLKDVATNHNANCPGRDHCLDEYTKPLPTGVGSIEIMYIMGDLKVLSNRYTSYVYTIHTYIRFCLTHLLEI